jgi:hypothetical protein
VSKPLLVDDQQASSKLEVEFAEILEPFEADAGASLKGWGRQKCLEAFAAHPGGFQACMSEALERGRNPIALLVQMVKDGDHADRERISGSKGDIQIPKLELAAPNPDLRSKAVCFVCDREVDDAYYIGGQWYCPDHAC